LLDDLPNVFLNQELIDAAKKRLESPEKYPLTHRAYRDIQAKAEDFYENVSLSDFPVYTGKNRSEYRSRVYNGLAQTLYPAIVCAFEDKQEYCQKAIDFILAWAEKKGGTQLTEASRSNLSSAGLDISRYFARYAQAFQLVSPYMSEEEKETVKQWFLELGYEIKKGHKYWIKNLEREGANNHLSWHNSGMLIAALYGEDRRLLAYMMNGNRWSYQNLVRDAIYEQDNPENLFRVGRDFVHLPTQARTGEIYDRHRSLPHPPARGNIYDRQRWWNEEVRQRAGFAYSKFNLEALMITAHMAQLNGLEYGGSKNFINLHNRSIRNALRFYGQYYIDFPAGRADCRKISEMEPSPKPYDGQCPIAYEPYFGERPSYHTVYLFALAKKYYPEDKALYTKILSANRKELIPVSNFHPLHAPVSVFTLFFAEE
ncbi:alginate lyase family protein, partial [Lyngbya aestuarii BL J]